MIENKSEHISRMEKIAIAYGLEEAYALNRSAYDDNEIDVNEYLDCKFELDTIPMSQVIFHTGNMKVSTFHLRDTLIETHIRYYDSDGFVKKHFVLGIDGKIYEQ